jgi:DNA adenine methylase
VQDGVAKNKTPSSDRVSPLVWVGGKRWQVPLVEPLWDAYQSRWSPEPPRFVEPFCGGASMSFGIQPKNAVLYDVNPHLINFHQHVQRGMTFTEQERERFVNTEDNYYEWRTWYNEMRDLTLTELHAKVFYFLNQTCRCGMYRVNRAGEFNVPYGDRSWTHLTPNFMQYVPVMQSWSIQYRHYAHIKLYSDDFVYADPPYDSEFTTYIPGGFTWEDQVVCAEWLSVHPGPVVATNQDTPRIRALYTRLGFDIQTVKRNIRLRSSKGEGGSHDEVLMTRNVPVLNSLF